MPVARPAPADRTPATWCCIPNQQLTILGRPLFEGRLELMVSFSLFLVSPSNQRQSTFDKNIINVVSVWVDINGSTSNYAILMLRTGSDLEAALTAAGCDLSLEIASGQVEQLLWAIWHPLLPMTCAHVVGGAIHLCVQGVLPLSYVVVLLCFAYAHCSHQQAKYNRYPSCVKACVSSPL